MAAPDKYANVRGKIRTETGRVSHRPFRPGMPLSLAGLDQPYERCRADPLHVEERLLAG